MTWKAITDDMDAREIESLSMLSRGFQELRDVNPELSLNVILDILAGLNEYVEVIFGSHPVPLPANGCCALSVMRLYGNTCRPPRDCFPTDELRERAR
jgi:hypothetical protein